MFATARAKLAARMATWTTTPICWPNTPPLTSSNVPWVRFHVLGGDEQSYVTSGPVFESGWCVVQCFAPAGSGDGAISTHADNIATLFRRYQSETLICGAPEKVTVGESDGWYQINVKIPWTIAGS